MCEGGEGPTDHILPPQQVYSGAKVHQKAAAAQAARPGTQAVKGAGPESWTRRFLLPGLLL